MFELLSHITKTIIARPGMSFVNEDQKKNVFQVNKQLERRQHQFVIWHDDISNSIFQHPQQETAAFPEAEFVAELKKWRASMWLSLI